MYDDRYIQYAYMICFCITCIYIYIKIRQHISYKVYIDLRVFFQRMIEMQILHISRVQSLSTIPRFGGIRLGQKRYSISHWTASATNFSRWVDLRFEILHPKN